MTTPMDQYLKTVDFLNQSSGGKSIRQDNRPLNVRLRVGEVYAVRATDNPNYYFTVTIHPNPFAGGYRKVISQFPVYGDPPPGMQVVSQEQVFKQFRELNGETNYLAFPFTGRYDSSNDLRSGSGVSQLHRKQLRRY